MACTTGFSDVDGSDRAALLVQYLAEVARMLAPIRRADLDRLGVGPGTALLDAGCGAGELAVEVAGRVAPGGRVAGIDASDVMIGQARRAAAEAGVEVDFRVASIHALPFADASFDAVRSERVFQHLDDPAAALRELVRVARPGGRVMVIDPDHSQGGLGVGDAALRRTFEASVRAQLRMIANPCVGTRLRGLMVDAGLADVTLEVRAVEMSWPQFRHAMFFDDRLAAAVEAGEATSAEAAALVAALEAQHRAGTFFANVIGYSAMGVKR